jgi:hypothetical protein
MKVHVLRFCAILMMVATVGALTVTTGHAQTSGVIAGKVVDASSGDPLIGANIVLEGTSLGSAANEEGLYRIMQVPPGVYTLKASIIGYSTTITPNVRVLIDLTTTVDFEAKTETVRGEEIVVTATRPVIASDISGSQVNIDAEELTAASFQDINNVITAQVGVEDVSSSNDRPSIRGSSLEESLFLIDGVSQGDPLTNRPLYNVNMDAIQEIKMETGGFSARYGDFRSGIINVVTKEGGQKYHGSANLRYSPAGLKHFGPMPFGHESPLSVPFVDPDAGAFTGVDAQGNENAFFDGWNAEANDALAPGDPHYGQADELYAVWLWRHRSQDSIDELKRLESQGVVDFADGIDPDDETYHETGVRPDFRQSFTFGGPVPGVNQLQETTFFVTYDRSQTEYAYRMPQRAYEDDEFRAKVTTRFGKNVKLNLHSYFSSQVGGDGGQGADIGGRISDNPYNAMGSENKFWYPHCAVSAGYDRQIHGMNLTHQLTANTYYEIKFTHMRSDYAMLPESRETSPGTNGIPSSGGSGGVQNGRIGDAAYIQEMIAKGDDKNNDGVVDWNNWEDWARIKIGDHWYDEAPRGYGPTNFRDITGEYRMESCNIRTNETYSRSYDFQVNVVSQINRHNQVETGFSLRRDKIHQLYKAIDPSVNGGSFFKSDATELIGGLYIQDKLEYEGFVANIGVRMDWLRGGEFPELDLRNGGSDVGGPYNDLLLGGGPKDGLTDPIMTDVNTYDRIPLKRHSKAVFSPRLGISHPISSVAKIFFNYGHMYQWPDAIDRYQMQYETTRGYKIRQYGNPGLAPPRTIAYELGYEHNLFDKMSLRLAGFYKDINNEDDEVRYYVLSNSRDMRVREPQDFRDVRGIEVFLELRRYVVPYFSGWASVNYLIESGGEFGYDRYYEDPSRQSRQVSTEVSNPDVRPVVKLNMDFHTPDNMGPSWGEAFYPFGGINASLLYFWKRGNQFTWNPKEIELVEDNLRWKAYERWDLRLTKQLVSHGDFRTEFYIDVINLFNNKNMTHPRGIDGNNDGRTARENSDNFTDDDFAWNGHRWWNTEVRDYLESMGYTDANQDLEGNFKNTNGSPGDYGKGIDMPAFTPYTFLESRDIFFGFKFYF